MKVPQIIPTRPKHAKLFSSSLTETLYFPILVKWLVSDSGWWKLSFIWFFFLKWALQCNQNQFIRHKTYSFHLLRIAYTIIDSQVGQHSLKLIILSGLFVFNFVKWAFPQLLFLCEKNEREKKTGIVNAQKGSQWKEIPFLSSHLMLLII